MSKLITGTVYVTSAGSTEGARGVWCPDSRTEIGIDATFHGIRVSRTWFAPARSPGLLQLDTEVG